MAKVLYNTNYGVFALSEAVLQLYTRLRIDAGHIPSWHEDDYLAWDVVRHDPLLIQAVEILGIGNCHAYSGHLAIREIPDGARYRIHEYDGAERVILFDEEKWEIAE